MDSWVLGRKFCLQNLLCMFWVLFASGLQCLESASPNRRDSVKALSLPAAILQAYFSWEVAFLNSPLLKISCNLLGALENQPSISGQPFACLQLRKLIRTPKPFPFSHRPALWKRPVPCCSSPPGLQRCQGQLNTDLSDCKGTESRKAQGRNGSALLQITCRENSTRSCPLLGGVLTDSHLGASDVTLTPRIPSGV